MTDVARLAEPPGTRPDWLITTGTAGLIEVPVQFLDIDGTVREGADERGGRFVNGPDDVTVFAEALHQMRFHAQRGGRNVGVSNQAGVPAGYLTEDNCLAAMARTQELCDDLFDLIMVCLHPTDAGCWCRKPRPGMLVAAVRELAVRHPGETYPPHRCRMVGDRSEDEACARVAGVPFVFASQWRAQVARLL
jgi:D-glycero-D-manno-heptose 1,7-bisphosphate phosphatase